MHYSGPHENQIRIDSRKLGSPVDLDYMLPIKYFLALTHLNFLNKYSQDVMKAR